MCGIFGYVSKSKLDGENKPNLLRSLNTLKYRGPDGVNTWTDNKCFLGFRHLSFFNKPTSLQPLQNEDGNLHLVCNGEIFNHKELNKKLAGKHRFQTNSDCETILHLYEEFGENFLRYIKGQFALILYDAKKQLFLAARDRFGICPLYYLSEVDTYIFASEIKAILDLKRNQISLDLLGLAETLFFYGPTPPRTCFKNIFQIPPGTYLRLDAARWKMRLCQYWKIEFTPQKAKSQTLSNHSEKVPSEFNYLLEKAVTRRIHGDFVPGVYAGGGVDSASIAAILAKQASGTTLYSLQFENRVYDESSYQKILADFLKLRHKTLLIRNQDIVKNLTKTVWHSESPLIRTAPVPMLLLSQFVKRNGHKCIISGEGADELLAGYPVFQRNQASIVAKFDLCMKVLDLFNKSEKLEASILRIYQKLIKNSNLSRDSLLHFWQQVEISTKLSRYLLSTQGDRVALANGVEQRFPFLDEDLVEFTSKLPDSWLIFKKRAKYILKRAMLGKIPDIIIDRPKQGYLAPDSAILDLYISGKSYLNHLLSQRYLESTGYFDVVKVTDFLRVYANEGYLNDKYVNLAFVFMVTTQILHKLFIEKDLDFLSA